MFIPMATIAVLLCMVWWRANHRDGFEAVLVLVAVFIFILEGMFYYG